MGTFGNWLPLLQRCQVLNLQVTTTSMSQDQIQTPGQKLQTAMQYAFAHRPKVGGFPFLAECLRKAGVLKNVWTLPSTQCVYVFEHEALVQQGTPLTEISLTQIPLFDQDALIGAIRTDQAGESTFPEFLIATWNAGVVGYIVDFSERTVSYFGVQGECYVESYPAVEVGDFLI